ncbi:hypothetical protein D3C79_910450 [compost metagenome]
MVELLASTQRLAVGHPERLHFTGRAFDTHGHVAQPYRLARRDLDDQLRGLLGLGRGLDLGFDLGLIVAKCLRCFARLLLGPAAEAQ